MRRSDLHYDLPPELIAQQPVEPRDTSRLLVLHRHTGRIEHRRFRDIVEYLRAGDCLVLNDTSVVPARFFCRRTTGGRIEALFLHAEDAGWHVLLKPAARLAAGERLRPEGGEVELRLVRRLERGEWLVRPEPPVAPLDLLRRIGQTPLPPYIRRDAGPLPADSGRYQTVYAARPGAVAAPTAGLHFTPELLARLEAAGIRRATVTLHVGPGTFQPIDVDDLSEHPMHAEWYEAPQTAIQAIAAARRGGGRIVAVGTTSARVLESLPEEPAGPQSGWTRLFIYPPYRFRRVDALVTNFHLPGSTLLALVMALAGREQILAAYGAAIRERYRFYSYGDAMLIL